jgi:hypothetical protein
VGSPVEHTSLPIFVYPEGHCSLHVLDSFSVWFAGQIILDVPATCVAEDTQLVPLLLNPEGHASTHIPISLSYSNPDAHFWILSLVKLEHAVTSGGSYPVGHVKFTFILADDSLFVGG